MERLLQLTMAWIQMLIAVFLVAVAGFNCWRVVTGEYDTVFSVLFIFLLVATLTLLVLSVRDYAKLLDEDKELENIKSKT